MSRWFKVLNTMLMCGAMLWCACNETPVDVALNDEVVDNTITLRVFNSDQMDILWVVDNSGSMCQEQKVLRDNFGNFVDTINNATLDFHIGVTTTHAPQTEAAKRLEPVAQEAKLQFVPQPVPGIDRERSCIQTPAIRESLNAALRCVQDPALADTLTWTDEQIECAVDRPTADCGQQLNIPDRNNDGAIDTFDLFPLPSEYRTFPKVLKASDYRQDNGILDDERLKTDFGCISMVGTRGDGYERGLQVAVKAVSPEWTGGVEGGVDANPDAPNHGLIRKNANFAIVFVTDENDCSAPEGMLNMQSACGADICDYENARELNGESSVLFDVETLAKSFRANLSKTKGRDITEGQLLVASIHGNWQGMTGPIPTEDVCQTTNASIRDDSLISCETSLGKARSGDRYERFIRQFRNYYPNSKTKNDPKNFAVAEVGWMCLGDFSPALTAIGEVVLTGHLACDLPYSTFDCKSDSQCGTHPFSDRPGRCVLRDGVSNYCDTEVVYTLTLDNPERAKYQTLQDNPYCVPDSINQLGPGVCVLSPALYQMASCGSQGAGLWWTDMSYTQVGVELQGYSLSRIHRKQFSSQSRLDAR